LQHRNKKGKMIASLLSYFLPLPQKVSKKG